MPLLVDPGAFTPLHFYYQLLRDMLYWLGMRSTSNKIDTFVDRRQ